MLITQRTNQADLQWNVCELKRCSAVGQSEVVMVQQQGQTVKQSLIPLGWCVVQAADVPQGQAPRVYCCPEHAFDDLGRVPHDVDGNEIAIPRVPVDLTLVRRPLDDIGLHLPRGGA